MTRPLFAILLAVVAGCRLQDPPSLDGPLHAQALAAWAASDPTRAAPEPPVPLMGPLRSAPEPAAPRVPVVIDDPALFELQLRGSSLGEALLLVAELAGLNLALVGAFDAPVDLSLPAVPLQSAFELLVSMHGCSVELRSHSVVVRRDDPEGRVTRVFPLRSTAAESLQLELTGLIGEQGTVVANAARDVLMVTAPAGLMVRVDEYLAAVDRPERQLILEARILEISRDDLQEIGLEMALNDVAHDDDVASFVADLLTSSTRVLASFEDGADEVDFAINALRTRSALEILARPRLLAVDGKPATLEIVSEIPFVNATTTTEASTSTAGAQTVQEVEFKDVGLTLEVVPTIQEDGLVGLTIDQSVSEQTGVFLDIPVVDSRAIRTSMIVEDGRTIMIGGLQRTRTLQTTTGVPGLMDIPFLGRAFRSEVDQHDVLELVVLMTPRLVDPRTPMGSVTESLSVELPDPSRR